MPKLYTVKALAALFEKDEETIRRWIREGDVFPNAFKVKDGFYVPASDVKNLMRQNTTENGSSESRQTPAGSRRPGFVNRW